MKPLIKLGIRVTYYPSLWFNRVMTTLGYWRSWDWVDDQVLLGVVPSRKDLRLLAKMGVGAVVNMCEEFGGDTDELAACSLTQLYLPTMDYHSPTTQDMVAGVRFMREQIASGKKVLVHCKAGRGRSATLVVCYLMAAHGLSADEAFARTKKARSHVNSGIRYRPAVREIERMLRDGSFSSATLIATG